MADSFTLKDSLATRKYEITNVVRILQPLTESSLGVLLSVEDARAILSDRLAALSGQVDVNTLDIAQITDRLLEAVNVLTGNNFSIADLRDGTLPVSAVLDAIQSVTKDKKLVIYPRFELGNIAGQATGSIILTPEELAKYDSLSWADEQYGGLDAPYNVAIPTLASLAYSDETAVDLLYADKTPVFNDDNDRLLGFVSGFTGGNVINITWGKMIAGSFVPEAIPASVTDEVTAIVPMKTNLSVLPVTSLSLTKLDNFGVNQQDELENVQLVLANNGLTTSTELGGVLGLANVTVTDFLSATASALFPTGFNNVISAISAIVVQLQNILAQQASTEDVWPYVGQVEEDALVSAVHGILMSLTDNYTAALVDSFRTDENLYVGADKADVDIKKSVLKHGDEGMLKTYYLQQVNDDVAGKTSVIFKIQLSEPEVGNQDYEIGAILEIKGGRYGTGVSYNLVQFTSPLPSQTELQELVEYDLTALPHNPMGDTPLDPIVDVGETMWLRLVIKMDSAGVEFTPIIRNYQLFV
jgi:hypothetical protein